MSKSRWIPISRRQAVPTAEAMSVRTGIEMLGPCSRAFHIETAIKRVPEGKDQQPLIPEFIRPFQASHRIGPEGISKGFATEHAHDEGPEDGGSRSLQHQGR